jgi:hypothetical protein
MINPFGKNESNEIMQYTNNQTDDRTVMGLIFETD